jgi:AMP-binding enzyme
MTTTTGTMATAANSLPGLLLTRAAQTPNAIALTFHDLGIWNPVTWAELAERVAQAANALAQSGVGRSEVVALISENRPEWIVADLAIQAIGAVSLPLRPELSPERIRTLCRDHQVRHFLVGDQQQFDKISPLIGAEPELGNVRGMALVFDPRGISATELATSGTLLWSKAVESASTTGLAARTNELDSNTVCTHTVVITKPENAPPSVEVFPESATSLVAAAQALQSSLNIHAGDQLYPFANLADPTERSLCQVVGLLTGSTVNMGEGGLLTTLESRAVQPTIAHVPAEELNRMHSDILGKRAKRGIRTVGVNRILRGARVPSSRAALPDLLVTYSVLAGWVVASLTVHSALRTINGAIRLGIIAGLAVAALGFLVLGGYGVRPFLRKAYGLGRARSLLTGPGISTDTAKLLDGLKLSPVRERLGHVPRSDSRSDSQSHSRSHSPAANTEGLRS